MMNFGFHKLQSPLTRLTAIALCLGILGQGTQALARFKPKRGIGQSGQRIGLASRGGCAVASDSKPLTAIVPLSNGVTASALPSLPWFMPEHTYPSTEVRLMVESDLGMEIMHRQVFENLPQNQVVSFDLAEAGLPPLEAGKVYKWQVHLVCDPDIPSGNLFAEGWLEYEPVSPTLEAEMGNASPKEKATLWLENGYWYDGVESMIGSGNMSSSPEWQALMNHEHVNLPHLSSLPATNVAE